MAERKLRDRFGQEIEPGPPLASTDTVNELLTVCDGCGQTVLVCGYIDDLAGRLYRCLTCRPTRTAGLAAAANTCGPLGGVDTRAGDLADTIARARKAQGGKR